MHFKTYILRILLVFVLVVAGGVGYWQATAYQPLERAKDDLISDQVVTVLIDDFITFTPTETLPTKGFIFYPGAKVEASAYAPLARAVAKEGYEFIIVPMPLNFSMLGVNKAQKVIEEYDHITDWTIGGHSLGGVAASVFAANSDAISGLVLLASYPANDALKESQLAITSLWGTRDGVINFDNLEDSFQILPETTVFIELDGGNHAQFGDYGAQVGDLEAILSPLTQINETAEAIIQTMNR